MTDASETMKSLSPFVGIWNTEGQIRASDEAEEQTMVATDIYEWLPGKCFLLHRVDARMGEDITRSTEIIGWDSEARTLFSTSYDAKGETSRFRCALDGHDWKIDGQGIRLRGAFDEDWNKLTGTWEMEADGSWSPWMGIVLTKAD
ncbi:DUF1579 family protein [Paracoccus solventivorans]|uniref:DUF1579 family protein n=1 Tax=Paracoccus solventivorans TaxID=53463 RepID=UPI001356647A|nr:DUF1579 family protein [Paracoccus solventivorans]